MPVCTWVLVHYLSLLAVSENIHGLRTPGKKIAFTARPEIQSQSKILRYGQRIFCLPNRPKFSDFHWVSVPERIYNSQYGNGALAILSLSFVQIKGKHCQKPHCRNGVVDTFGPYSVIIYHSFSEQ